MTRWLIVLGIAVAVLALSYGVLILLARRLPPGLLRDLVELLPACVTTARRLRRHPSVPRRAKVVLVVAGLWLLSPIDLIPEFLPVIGPLDDIVVAVLALRYAARSVPRSVFYEAWPAERRLVRRLVGDEDGAELR
jgi:uncharacterized membrane protein YkvA (DUF1232 family)